MPTGGDDNWPANTIRAQMVWQSTTGLPEDRWVNVFHFHHTSGITDAMLSTAAQKVLDFYNLDHGGGSSAPIVQSMPLAAIDVASSEVRVYNLSDPSPREPWIQPYAGIGPYNGEGYPAEVALCLSYYAERNIARQRGRIYLGPLNRDNAVWVNGQCRPSQGLMTGLLAGGIFLATDNQLEWVIASKATGAPVVRRITDVWVDDAWDTQRRRGVAPSNRLTGVGIVT